MLVGRRIRIRLLLQGSHRRNLSHHLCSPVGSPIRTMTAVNQLARNFSHDLMSQMTSILCGRTVAFVATQANQD
jgi:hypothetical protein